LNNRVTLGPLNPFPGGQPIKWPREASGAIAKVPFFVRKRVKKRVEEEAIRCGAAEVLLDHIKTYQRRFLIQMEEEVQGYPVETCFGPSRCPGRVVISGDFSKKIEECLAGQNLKSFLKARVKGPLKMHHGYPSRSGPWIPHSCGREIGPASGVWQGVT